MSTNRKTGVLAWLGSTVNDYLDRASDELLAPHVAWMEAELSRLKESFDFTKAAEARRLPLNDREIVAMALYRKYLGRCWQDARLGAPHRQGLRTERADGGRCLQEAIVPGIR